MHIKSINYKCINSYKMIMTDIDLNNIIFNKVLSANACINCDIFPISICFISE